MMPPLSPRQANHHSYKNIFLNLESHVLHLSIFLHSSAIFIFSSIKETQILTQSQSHISNL